MVLSVGQNCIINDVETLDKTVWENRTKDEVSKYASAVTSLMKKGKQVFILCVPRPQWAEIGGHAPLRIM